MSKLTTNVYAIFIATIVLFVGICGIGPNRLAAQGTTATISGIVTDSSHGAIAEAAITVKNVGTGITVSATTDAQGRYSVPDLEIGDYEVQVSKAGFTAMIHKGVTLTVGSNSVVDFALSVGSQTQTVTVEAQVVQVETTNSSISALIDPKQMRDLPLNGRSFEQLIQLSPGVNAVTPASVNARQGNAVAESYAGAGARAEGAAILLDDEDINSWYKRGVSTITGSSLGIEAMAEFQVLTNTYGAQFGGNALVVNAVSRAGTNSFHGSVYEFLRNSALDARNFFDGPTIPSFRRNQFGGSLGGPIKKDKLFFFANYEGLRLSLGETVVATVPDATHRTPAASVTDPTSYKAIVDTLALIRCRCLILTARSAPVSSMRSRRRGARKAMHLCGWTTKFRRRIRFSRATFWTGSRLQIRSRAAPSLYGLKKMWEKATFSQPNGNELFPITSLIQLDSA